jgi:tetratricopeptide (TPR) repeat protein
VTDDRPRSLQDLVRSRQRSGFVGRRDVLAAFAENLELGVDDPRRRFLFDLVGDAGVGKSTLVAQLIWVARDRDHLTCLADESAPDVPACLAALAEDLQAQGVRCRAFRRARNAYQQRQREFESDPAAPPRPSGLLSSAIGIGLRLAGGIPVAGPAMEGLDRDAMAREADRFQAYLRRKLRSSSEIELMWTPEKALTRAFLADLRDAAKERPVVVFLDAFEYTSAFLQRWLVDLLGGAFGDVPVTTVFVTAGQRPLDVALFGDYLAGRAVVPVSRFTDQEARQLLHERGVRDEEVVRAIIERSAGLPLLLASYSEGRPRAIGDLGDRTNEVVERFLKWEPDFRRRSLALHGALPRVLNEDVLGVATGIPERATEEFARLRDLTFVKQHGDGLRYHELARGAMVRYVRTTMPLEWRRRHLDLAEHYDARRTGLGMSERAAARSRAWQQAAIEHAYHRACAEPGQAAALLLEGLVLALVWRRELAANWAKALTDVAADAGLPGLAVRTARIVALAPSVDETDLLDLLTELSRHPSLDAATRAMALAERGDVRRRRGEYPQALADLDRAVALSPTTGLVVGRRGEVRRLMGRHREAIEDFDRAIELAPGDAELLASRGESFRVVGRFDEALADLTAAVALSAGYSWALMRRAQVYRQLDRFDEALADLGAAIEAAPDSSWVVGERGETHRLRGDLRAAVDDLTEAITLEPGYAWAHASRGEACSGLERFAEAIADFDRAIELDPGYAWAFGGRAQARRRMGDPARALADLDRSIELNPGYVWAYVTRARVRREQGRTEPALGDVERALALRPMYVPAYLERARLRSLLGDDAGALADLDRCADLDPGGGWAHYRAYLLLREHGEADAGIRLELALSAEAPTRILPRDARHDLNRCVYQLAAGDPAESRRSLDAALAGGARPVELRAAAENLTELAAATGVEPEPLLTLLRAELARA